MKYIVVHFSFDTSSETTADILASQLGEAGYESFINTDTGMDAYIPARLFDEKAILLTLENFPFQMAINFSFEELEDKNWNEEWEKNFFEPIIIDDQCIIHSSFHKNIPHLKYDIIIDPKMAFGTGHHETTSLMIAEILKIELQAILAAMRGAAPVTAIDIDDWCVDNSLENIRLNAVSGIEALLGGAELLAGLHFDVVLANINRNILLNDMKSYAETLAPGGELYMSGFYTEDVPVIEAKARELGFSMQYFLHKNNWAVVKMKK